MKLFSPQIEAGYPENCITVENAIEAVKRIFADPGFRVTSFQVKTITAEGNTLRLAFDRKNVGQAPSVNTQATDAKRSV